MAAYMHAYKDVRKHACMMQLRMYACTYLRHVRVYVSMCTVGIHTHTDIHIYIERYHKNMYIYKKKMCVCMYICIYIHIYTNSCTLQ